MMALITRDMIERYLQALQWEDRGGGCWYPPRESVGIGLPVGREHEACTGIARAMTIAGQPTNAEEVAARLGVFAALLEHFRNLRGEQWPVSAMLPMAGLAREDWEKARKS